MNTDIETILRDIETYTKANLNTKITEINDEKNDDIVLETIATDAFFVQSLNNATANFDPHILIGLGDIQNQGGAKSYAGTVKELVFGVFIIKTDYGTDLQIAFKMFRYLRVLEEFFQKNFDKIVKGATFEVNSFVPDLVRRIDSNDTFRAAGVEITVHLG